MPSDLMPRKKNRRMFRISDCLNQRLNTYARVATAAGVSALALAGASEAEVVYTEMHQVTHTGFPLYIDLNNDGIKDFVLRTTFYRGTSGLQVGLDVSGYRNAGNAVAGSRYSSSGGYFLSAASALPAGAGIGPRVNFSVPSPFMAAELFTKDAGSECSNLGRWAGNGSGVKNRYLGMKFMIDGEVHYGWARLSVTLGHHRQFGDVSATLTGYAYETVPDQPIIAGKMADDVSNTVEPETLGALALGRK